MTSSSTVSATKKGAVATAVAEIAQAIGEKPERIRVVDPQWATMLSDGLVIELHIESGSFETPVRIMSDIGGLPFKGSTQRLWQQYVRSHGSRLIFPKEEIREIERLKGEMRNLLNSYAHSTTLLRRGRFMPLGQAECARCGEGNLKAEGEWAYAPLALHTARAHKGEDPLGKERGWWYDEFRTKLKKLIEQYMAEADRLAGKHRQLFDQAITDAVLFADDSFARLLREGNAPTDDQQEFIDQYVVRPLRRRFPSKEKLRSDFKVELTRNFLPLASMMAEDQSKARGIIAEERALEIAAQELAKAKTAVERDIIEARREEIAKFNDFVSDMEGGVRTLLYDASIDALAILDRREGVLPTQTADRLAEVIKSMRALQFGVADEELEQQIRKLRMAVAVAPRSEKQYTKSGADVAFENLEKVAAGLRLALIEIGRPPATRREKLVTKVTTEAGDREISTERDFDPGERVGIPNSVEALREMVAGRVRRVRGSVEEVPTVDLTTSNGSSRRSRKIAQPATT